MADLSIVKSEPLPLSVVKSEPLQRTFMDSVKDAGSAFWDWTGKPVAYALGLSGGTDAERGDKAREAQKQIVQGIMNEPGRIRQELTNSLDAFVSGNQRSTMHHVLNAIPLLGPGIDQAAQEFNQGQYAKGVGHTGALLAPAAAHELPAITGAVGDATRAMGTAAKEVIGTPSIPNLGVVGDLVKDPAVRAALKKAPGVKTFSNGIDIVNALRNAVKGAPEAAPPADLPPGFGVGDGTTSGPIPPSVARPVTVQPPVSGALPGSVIEAPGPQLPPGFGLSNGTTSGPIPAGAPRPVGMQPPVSGALPGTVVEAPPVRPVGPIDIGPDTRGGLSVAEQLRAYVDAQKAPPAPVTAADVAGVTPAKFAKLSPADQAAAQTTADALNRHAGRTEAPPAPAVPQAAPVEAPPAPIQQAIEPSAPRRMTLAEAEADMMAQSAPEVDTPQSQYQANGERKNSGIRAVDRETMNRTAKVSRVAQEIQEAVSKQGGKAYSQLSALPAPELEATLQSAAEMIGERKLSPASRNQIMAELKRMEAARDWLYGPTALDGIVAGHITEVQQPIAPGSGTPAQSGVQAFPSRSSSMSDRMPDPVKDTQSYAPAVEAPRMRTQSPEPPRAATPKGSSLISAISDGIRDMASRMETDLGAREVGNVLQDLDEHRADIQQALKDSPATPGADHIRKIYELIDGSKAGKLTEEQAMERLGGILRSAKAAPSRSASMSDRMPDPVKDTQLDDPYPTFAVSADAADEAARDNAWNELHNPRKKTTHYDYRVRMQLLDGTEHNVTFGTRKEAVAEMARLADQMDATPHGRIMRFRYGGKIERVKLP